MTEKATPDLTMVVHLVSPDDRYDMLYLANYANLRIRDELARIDGVGEARVFGAGDYAMRVWLDPEKVAALNLTASDVVRAIREQNVQVAAGQLGAPPAPNTAEFQLLIDTQGRLVTEEEFENIIVKTGEHGQITRLRDVAQVELGREHVCTPLTARQRTGSRYSDLPAARAATRSKSRTTSAPRWPSSRRISPRASTTRSSTTRRCSFASRSRPSSKRCSKRCSSWCSWSCCSCRRGAPR